MSNSMETTNMNASSPVPAILTTANAALAISMVSVPAAQFLELLSEKTRLQTENEILRKENHDLLLKFVQQDKRINEISKEYTLLQEEVTKLKEDNTLLQEEVMKLKEENEALKHQNKDLVEKFKKLEYNLSSLTLREAMRALENHCVRS
eukprot:TRINITY_DN3232_c0_g1_i1.p1 TRINITY_DN3232_c0_g1~~TRINITY_DN3232_c0_g1_i1.p1  ORF type:complete len:150 (+),score=30.00 TRINITY_DN3232_c0_g1_i1:121-570(+)